jgi:hypothetical protein
MKKKEDWSKKGINTNKTITMRMIKVSLSCIVVYYTSLHELDNSLLNKCS